MISFLTSAKVQSMIAANGPEYSTVYSSMRGQEVSQEEPEKKYYRVESSGVSIKNALKIIRKAAVTINPLLLFLTIPGLFLLAKDTRYFYLIIFSWLLILGSVLVPLKPQFEFDRMLILLAICSAIPASLAIEKIFQSIPVSGVRTYDFLLPSFVGGLLVASIFSTSSVLLNRSVEQFHFAGTEVKGLANAISTHGGEGRTLFSGFVLHDLSHGHLAPLADMTDKPMLASSYIHDLWMYKQIFPKYYFDRSDVGIYEYLDLFNVSAVLAHEPLWIRYFSERINDFKHVWSGGGFHFFKRLKSPNNYFLEGEGEIISQGSNGLMLKVFGNEAVIKFRYSLKLRSSACRIYEKKISKEVSFVGLKNCPEGEEIKLYTPPFYQRLLSVHRKGTV